MITYFFPANTSENEAYQWLRNHEINTWSVIPKRNGVYFYFEKH
jgi:hypothetical protein